jgi:peroxiredoxin
VRLGALLPVAVAVVVAAAVVLGFLYFHAPRATRVHAGDMAPDFTLPSIAPGSPPVRLSARRGGPTLLVFFDSRADGTDPYLQSLQGLHLKYSAYGLRVIAVAIDPTAPPSTLGKEIGVTFNILTDPFAAAVHPRYGTPRDPEAYLIDREGRVMAVYTQRVDWHTTEFQRMVQKNINLPG